MGPSLRAVNGRALLTTVLVVARFACAEALCTNATVTIDTGPYDVWHHWPNYNYLYWQVDSGARQGGSYDAHSIETASLCLAPGAR